MFNRQKYWQMAPQFRGTWGVPMKMPLFGNGLTLFAGRYKLALTGVVVFAATLAFMCGLLGYMNERQEQMEREQASYIAENILNKLDIELGHAVSITEIFKSTVKSERGEVREFYDIAYALYNYDDIILSIQLAPGGVVKYDYPMHTGAMTFNIMEDVYSRQVVEKMLRTKKPVVLGPLSLAQGGRGLILRNPIFLDGTFWGFSTVLLKSPDIFYSLQLDRLSDNGYTYNLSVDALGSGVKQSIFMSPQPLSEDPVSFSIDSVQQEWTLTVSPVKGWAGDIPHPFQTVFAVFVALLAAAVVVSVMINMRMQAERSERRAGIDELTQLPNRRGMQRLLQKLTHGYEVRGEPFCIAMCDIDYFKKINDTYGHLGGDKALRFVADVMASFMLERGFAIRFGGDEFMLAFKNCREKEARAAMNELVTDIASRPVPNGGDLIPVSMSFGVVEHAQGTTLYDTINAADERLYEVKRARDTGRK